MERILGFFGQYRFLSNFWHSPFELDGVSWQTVEHAFQAMKTVKPSERTQIRMAQTPGVAKRLGRKCTIRPDWEGIKREVMYDCVKAKFEQNLDLGRQLLDTGDVFLEETNTWGDQYWGVANGKGQNHLGKILMRVRDELRSNNAFPGNGDADLADSAV